MYSTRKNDGFAYCNVLWPAVKIGDNCHFTVVTCKGLAEKSFSNSVLALRCAYFLEKFADVLVGVREAMGKENNVVIVGEFDFKFQRIVVAAAFFLNLILFITHILSHPVPPTLLICFVGTSVSHQHTVHQRLHPLIIGALWLDQIYNIEFVSPSLARVAHREIIPLRVKIGAPVVVQNQIVFVFIHLDGPAQIPTFESTFKHKRRIVFVLHLIKRVEFFVVAAFSQLNLFKLVLDT